MPNNNTLAGDLNPLTTGTRKITNLTTDGLGVFAVVAAHCFVDVAYAPEVEL